MLLRNIFVKVWRGIPGGAAAFERCGLSELRRDPVTGAWVVIATERAKRPDQFRKTESHVVCPFCYGRESLTPPASVAYRSDGGSPDEPGWLVRVVPNKYPVFSPGEKLEIKSSGFYTSTTSVGGHELVVHSPDHSKTIPDLPLEQVVLILKAYKDRYLHFKEIPEVDFVEIMINHGKDAGASLGHPHSQIFAMPLIPPAVQEQLAGAEDHREATGRCIYCDLIEAEREAGERMIVEKNGYVCFAPYASRLPFETWILPVAHRPFFERIDEVEMGGLAAMLKDVLRRYNKVLADPSYNLFLHTTPCKSTDEGYHWHIEIIPKLTTIAGFEFGTGMMINVTTPEEAARCMRGTA